MGLLLQQLLTQSATRRPDQEAARDRGQGLTYRQLDRRTNQVARALWSAGVRRGDRVGICLNKSLASLVSLFGVLKAGGVYVPLDPNAPPARLAQITRDCDIRVLLTGARQSEALPAIHDAGTPVTTVVLTDVPDQPAILPPSLRIIAWDEVCAEEEAALPPAPAVDTDLAYILYTSGSTGRPKGVMIAHRTVFTFIDWCGRTFGVRPGDRVTSHAPIHFDLSTFDIFVTIKAGATIVLVPESLSLFPVQLVELLQEERITVTYLVPSLLALMVTYGQLDRHDLSALRLVLFAGEVFPITYLRRLVAAVPDAEYYNLYGPTETNVCTWCKVQPGHLAPGEARPVPIGRACDPLEVFAVDDEGRRVTEPGRQGELWVRGPGVAQGYWGDPAQTAGRFVPDPWRPGSVEVVYRTGDIVALDEDGLNWRYVGRRDQMVKSRGYRIELGDVEAALYAHAGVQEAAVVAVPDELIGSRLKAFVVPAGDSHPTVEELRAHCASRLPGYMLPERFEFRSALPKTSTGKVDRLRLAGRSGG